MDDALVPAGGLLDEEDLNLVLILVLMDDALVLFHCLMTLPWERGRS